MSEETQEKEIQEDINTMMDSLSEGTVTEPEPKSSPEEKGEDEPIQPTELEDNSKAQPQDEEPEIEDEEEPEPKPDVTEPDPIEDKDKIISELRTELAEKESVPKPEPEPEPAPKPEPLVLDDQDFLGDADPEDLVRNPAEFNKVLNKVFHQGIDTARKVLGEGILRAIPDIVKANIVSATNLQKASDEFYNKNKDLEPFKKVVGTVFEEIASDNPGKTYSDLLPLVGDEVRKRLDLHKQAVAKPNDKPKPPKLPRNKGRSTQPKDKPSTDPLLSQLDSMNKSLGGT